MSVAVEMLQPQFSMKPNTNTYDDRQQHNLHHQFNLIYLHQIGFIESICLILDYSVKADLFPFFPNMHGQFFSSTLLYFLKSSNFHHTNFYINFI